jgi:hypothetical protein
MHAGAAAAQEGVGLPHGDEQVVRGSGRAVLGVQVPLDGAEERFGPSGSMNREVKHGKRSPSDTQSLERPLDSELTSVSAG